MKNLLPVAKSPSIPIPLAFHRRCKRGLLFRCVVDAKVVADGDAGAAGVLQADAVYRYAGLLEEENGFVGMQQVVAGGDDAEFFVHQVFGGA